MFLKRNEEQQGITIKEKINPQIQLLQEMKPLSQSPLASNIVSEIFQVLVAEKTER